MDGWGRLLRSDAVLERLDAVLAELRESVGGSRTTLRMGTPVHQCHVDRVVAESLKPGVPSLRPDTSLNQRAMRTVIDLGEKHNILIQCDTINAPIRATRGPQIGIRS